jgi:hypothetical protein
MGYLWANTQQRFEGDFDLVVRFDSGTWEHQPGQCRSISVSVLSDEQNQIFAACTRYPNSGLNYCTGLQLNGRWGSYQAVDTTDKKGRLRIARSGGKVSTYYGSGGEWVRLDKFAESLGGPLYVQLAIANKWEATTPAPLSVEFTVEQISGGGGPTPAATGEKPTKASVGGAPATASATAGPPSSGAGWLGIVAQTLATKKQSQVRVLYVTPDSPAHGRLQAGDVLLVADQTPLTRVQQVVALLAGKREGDSVTFRVRRNKQEQTVTVPLGRTPPESQRTLMVSGEFRGESYSGTFQAYLDPSHRSGSGTMSGTGLGSLEATCQGPWDPDTGALQWTFKGEVSLLAKFSVEGVITGQVDRRGHGNGTFEGTGAAGTEEGTWTCEPLVSPDIVAVDFTGEKPTPAPAAPGGPGTPPETQGEPTPSPGDSGAPPSLADSVKRLEDALRAGDVEAAAALIFPDVRDLYRQVFQAHKDDLPQLADLLATRRFVALGAGVAEFEVTENGRKFPLTFFLLDGQWCLSGF